MYDFICKFIISIMKNILLSALACSSVVPALAQKSVHKSAQKPNVILIISDDQGYRDLGCYGAADLRTPNLDKLASEGTLFTQFYAGAAVSSPSRASLLTGRSPVEAGAPGNMPREWQDPDQNKGMPTTNPTIAKNLKAAGYYTALVGKWHLGEGERQSPLKHGFDYCFGHRGGCMDNYSHYFYWSGPNIHDLHRNDDEVYYPGRFFPDLIVEETGKIIEAERPEPFFIYCAFNVPHYPYQGKIHWLDYYREQGVPSPRRDYIAFVSTMDECIGEIVAKLKKEGKYENTVIIFQADQGYSVEERASFGGGDAGNLRGCKGSLFEGGIRVPAIIKYANVIPSGRTIDNMAYGVDWYNTIAEITGAKINPESQGTSLMPLLTGKSAKHPSITNWQYGDFNDAKAQWIARNGDWKLIGNAEDPRNPESLGREDRKFFLSNLAMDITESENLASKYPEKVAELKKQHDEWYAKAQKSPEYRARVEKQ